MSILTEPHGEVSEKIERQLTWKSHLDRARSMARHTLVLQKRAAKGEQCGCHDCIFCAALVAVREAEREVRRKGRTSERALLE